MKKTTNVSEQFNISDIYDKNLNFLIGSGASSGLFPTLQLKIKNLESTCQTIETLATQFEKDEQKRTLLFMHYYKECIEPVLKFNLESCQEASEKKMVLDNYKEFIKTILYVLRKKKNNDLKICNLFTTNYDGCIAHAADEIIKFGNEEFILNDGARGFFRRYHSAKNYSSHVNQSGVFDKYLTQIPQINLIHLHGSAYWKRDEDQIQVDYKCDTIQINNDIIPNIKEFSEVLNDDRKSIVDLPNIPLTDKQIKDFWNNYNRLPIVNPTKWKFHETVFEEHYYQMLRHLSYELEKPSTVLITFGFSFSDEHIMSLIKRSLGNPYLQVFVSCFNDTEYKLLQKKFDNFKNITFLALDNELNFSEFNKKVFALKEPA